MLRTLIIVLTAALLAACGRPDFGTTKSGGDVIDSDVDRAAANSATGDSGGDRDAPTNDGPNSDDFVDPGAPNEPVEGDGSQQFVGDFAFAAYRGASANGRNVVVAPHSVARSLVIAHAAAGPEVASVVAGTVQEYLGGEIYNGFNSSDLDLEARQNSGSFSMLAAIWAQDDIAVEEDLIETLALYLGQELRLIDFASSPEDARNQINNWYSVQTGGQISEVLGPRTLEADSRFVITDATWFAADWGFGGFDPARTMYATFEGTESNVQLPMMATEASLLYFDGDEQLQAVVLPFANGFSLVAVLPENLTSFESALGTGLLDRIIEDAQPRDVALRLPRLEVSDRVSLSSIADSIGVGAAFADDAEYTGFADGTQLDDAHQRTRLTFDERGVTLDAGTNNSEDPAPTPPPSETVELTFDRPFFFGVRDSQTGRYLFLGRLTQP